MVENINAAYEVNDGRNKIVSLCLVNCYGKISAEQSFAVNINLNCRLFNHKSNLK
jgi:hypothetical protein